MMSQETDPMVLRAVFMFLAGIPYRLFRVGYFVVTLPRRLRRIRRYRKAPKTVTFRRLGDRPMTVHCAVEAIHALRARESQCEFPASPSIFDLLEALWEEEVSEFWKFPTVSDLATLRSELCEDMDRSGVPPARIWAIDDHARMFVGYDPRTGREALTTPDTVLAVLRGRAPDSRESCLLYAVTVTPRYEDDRP